MVASICLVALLAGGAPPAGAGGAKSGSHWADVRPGDPGYWARRAIRYVADTHWWMRDYGSRRFHPERLETRLLLAKAVVRAFAPDVRPDPSIHFRDLPGSNRWFPYANVAVKLHWMPARHRRFHPDASVDEQRLFQVLGLALGLRRAIGGSNRIHDADGHVFRHRRLFGGLVVGTDLGLRYQHTSQRLDVEISRPLPRAEVAWSLYRAATLSRWEIRSRMAPYAHLKLGHMSRAMRAVTRFGLRFVGYPYIYAAEWGRRTPPGYCCGAQRVGGFDCSGLMWWLLKRSDWSYDVPRPYRGWSLDQRSSMEMAAATPKRKRVSWSHIRPGDLMLYDSGGTGTIDHVDLALGGGWALDASGIGSVIIVRVASPWYRQRFVFGRRIVPR